MMVCSIENLALFKEGKGETWMTDLNGEKASQVPDWKLLAEFVLMNLSHSNRYLTTHITEALQGLSIQPIVVEHIVNGIVQTLFRMKLNMQPAGDLPAVRIRIWSSVTQTNRGGWGFFLLEKPVSECPRVGDKITNILDLFLYQERTAFGFYRTND
jgi:hypothetical protein